MEDTKLIRFYFIKNELNIKQIVNDYSKYVFTIVKNMTKNLLSDEDIEEIISDVFLAVWKNQKKLKRDMPLKPYLSVVTRNIVKNALKSNKNLFNLLELQEDIKANFDVNFILELQEETKIISNELDKMKDDSKIFIMFYYYGKKVKEISKELGYTQFNVNTKLHRIRKRIKKALEERGYNYGK